MLYEALNWSPCWIVYRLNANLSTIDNSINLVLAGRIRFVSHLSLEMHPIILRMPHPKNRGANPNRSYLEIHHFSGIRRLWRIDESVIYSPSFKKLSMQSDI